MKLKTQELIRQIELYSYLGVSLATVLLNANYDFQSINEINQFLQQNQIDMQQIRIFLSNLYSLDIMTSFRTQTLTEEYKQLDGLYKEIIKNTGEFYKNFGIDHPVCIFAMYVYMYRNGYFSYDKQFQYSTKMKDFARLNGLDVIRGYGVCRSIGSMLTDIYQGMNMTSYNLLVNTNAETISKFTKLCPTALTKDNKGTVNFVKFVTVFTKYIPLSNHLITMVEKENVNYIFDPTNDGFLCKGNGNCLVVANDSNYHMKKHNNILFTVLGQYSGGLDIHQQRQQLELPTISFEEYKSLYLQTLNLCLKNQDLFEKFYQDNYQYMHDIESISKEQSGYIKRLFPLGIRK